MQGLRCVICECTLFDFKCVSRVILLCAGEMGDGSVSVGAYRGYRLGFYEEFLIGGIAAGISKTGAAPIERVKLLIQNQVRAAAVMCLVWWWCGVVLTVRVYEE